MSSVGCIIINHRKYYLTETMVPISPQTSIYDLNKLLMGMKRSSLCNVNIDMLEVWKCTDSALHDVDMDLDELRERLRRVDFSNEQTARKLCPTLKVSSLGLQKDEMLLVRLPSPLRCLFVDLDQKPLRHVSVNVSPDTNVFNVKETVLAKIRTEIGVNELVVWRCFGLKLRGDQEDYQEFEARVRTFDLSNNQHAEKLSETCNVLELKVPPDEVLLVQVHNVRQDKRKHDDNDDLSPQIKRLRMEIANTPSFLATADRFRKIAGPEHVIAFNRPFEPFTIPLVLLHEIFSIFKDRCEQAPSERALICLNELVPVACTWHSRDLTRKTEIRSVLEWCMGLRFHEQYIPGTEFMTDGNLAVIVMPALIRACKNEHGDVLNQAILSYANFLSKALEDPRRFYDFNTRFPSILMVDMGSFLGFYGAVWDGKRVRVEPLTPLFDLSTHLKETKARSAIAASFDALMVAVKSIEAHYKSIEAEANWNPTSPKRYDPDLQKARGYPFLTSYEDNGQEIKFMYNERLHDEKLIFSATLIDPPDCDEFVAKFTQWYSEDAHNCLASHNLAPRLRRCVRISADWIAVIMDESKYRKRLDLMLSGADKEKVRAKVTSMVRMLHQQGFVHGDIREANILIDKESLTSDDVRIHLIDFDWAGPIGEAKYPADVNKITVRRPGGVQGGGLITEQHDIEMASFLFA